jgi:hypothetical protein
LLSTVLMSDPNSAICCSGINVLSRVSTKFYYTQLKGEESSSIPNHNAIEINTEITYTKISKTSEPE